MWSIYARSHFELSQEATVCLSSFPGKETLCGLIIIFIYISYIFIYFSSLVRSLSCYWEIAHLSHLRSIVFINDVTKMVTGLKLQSPKKKKNKQNKTSENRRGGSGVKTWRPAAVWLPVTDSCSREDTVCLMLWHQRGGGGGSFPVELLSLSWRFSSATSRGMISTQPIAPKSAKSRRSSSSEDELSSRISVDRRSSWTNKLRSARSPSRNCRSASDILGSFNLWERQSFVLGCWQLKQ